MTPQCNKHNSSVFTLLLLSTISIIAYHATQLYQRPTLKGSKVMAKSHSNKRIDQMHENQENNHNKLQYIK